MGHRKHPLPTHQAKATARRRWARIRQRQAKRAREAATRKTSRQEPST